MELPEDTTIEVQESLVKVNGPNGGLEKNYNPRTVKVTVDGRQVKTEAVGKPNRKKNAAAGAINAHIRNMIKGVHEDYSKKLQLVYAHFPVSLEVKGNEVLIKNFLGEKKPRKSAIVGGTKVEVKGQEITVTGKDKEAVGQTASNLYRITKTLNRDERVFQDGIYYE